jgi:hypothetical protein
MHLKQLFPEFTTLKALLASHYPSVWCAIKDRPLCTETRLLLNSKLSTNALGTATPTQAAKVWIEAINARIFL